MCVWDGFSIKQWHLSPDLHHLLKHIWYPNVKEMIFTIKKGWGLGKLGIGQYLLHIGQDPLGMGCITRTIHPQR